MSISVPFNKFYFIEISLEVSYHFATFGRMGIGATLGVSPVWLVRQKGYYLKKDESGVVQLSSIKSYNSFIVNGQAGIDFYYMLSERINISLRPQLKTNFNSLFTKEYNVDQRYYSTGVNVGVVYSFK